MTPSFEEVAEVIRHTALLPPDREIARSTRLEDDLGITGDDGGDLISVVSVRFAVELTRSAFGLSASEYLFHNEGIDPFGLVAFVLRLSGREYRVRPLTAGDLHRAIANAVKEVDR